MQRNAVAGIAAALGAVLIWASWNSVTRLAAQDFEVAVIVFARFAVPALIFLPALLRVGLVPKNVPRPVLAAMVIGGGLGFFSFAALSLKLAPVPEVGPLLPSAPLLFVALYNVVWDKIPLGRRRALGYTLIALGIFAIAGLAIVQSGRVNSGHVFALLAAFFWAVYTIAFVRSRLSALEAAAVVAGWSALAIVPFGLLPTVNAIADGHLQDLAVQWLMQGVFVGVGAFLLFGMAVRFIGAQPTAAFSALTPALTVVIAVPMLGEWPTAQTVVGIVAIVLGVAVANWPRVREKRQPSRETSA